MASLPFRKTILYEDDDYFVVHKPPLVATLADREVGRDSMLSQARRYCASAQVCHRLDKGTSGALAFAKHPLAYKHLCQQFAAQQVQKVYHAVVEGIHAFHDKCVEAPMAVKHGNKAVIDAKHGKKAFTRFDTLAYFWKHTLVACTPLTGKTHQIRLHAASEGAPLVGDLLYGGHLCYLSQLKKNYRVAQGGAEQPLLQRVALHALHLGFDTLRGERVTVHAPYAKDFKALIYQLRKHT